MTQGIGYLLAPPSIIMMILFPRVARWVSTIGMTILCVSLALSSFSTNVTHLILSQGIGFGIGGCLAYTPSILYMSEWFLKRKGLAFGIVWVSTDICGQDSPSLTLHPGWLGNIWSHLPTGDRMASWSLWSRSNIENLCSRIICPRRSIPLVSQTTTSSILHCVSSSS